MKHSRMARFTGLVAGVAVASVVLGTAGDAQAKPRRKGRQPADVTRIEAPLGLAGTRGSGANVAVPFSLVDASRRKTDIEVQYGVDLNGSGVVEDSEFRTATENRTDERNTRKNRGSQKFATAANIGAANAFVWDTSVDAATDRFPTLEIEYTPQGRVVEDPDNPGQPNFRPTQPGVRVRVRAVIGSGRRATVGDWSVTEPFALNNNNIPRMTIDAVVPNTTSSPTAADEDVEIRWTAFDPDSEDVNGNGVFDNVLGNEDIDGDGIFDNEPVAVAFDYYRLQPGDNPAAMTPEQLNALVWLPCSRSAGLGDPDDGVPSAPGGLPYKFFWDSKKDVGTVNAQFILRARPFDAKREHGDHVFLTNPIRIDNWKVFNPGHPDGNADLSGGRVGLSVTNLPVGLVNSDPLRPAPFQGFLAAGGATADGGGGTTNLDVFFVNTETSETSEADRAAFSQLKRARAWHSATQLDDGRVLFVGGVNENGVPQASTEIFDPVTRSTELGPDLNVARSHHTAVRLSSGDVAIFGGIGTGGQVLASCEVFRFTAAGQPNQPFVPGPDMAVAQQQPIGILLPNQQVLVTGGLNGADPNTAQAVQTAEIYDPLHDDDLLTPTTKNPRFLPAQNGMLEARKFGRATALLDGNVLFSGGASSPAKSSLEVFNPVNRSFEPVNVPMPDGGRAQHLSVMLGDGSVLLAGGTPDPNPGGTPAVIAQADVFRLGARDGSGTWSGTFLPVNGDMIAPRRNAVATAINAGRVFILGGTDANGLSVQQTETYTPEGGVNGRPSAVVTLASDSQSWAFGAPLLYRTVDPELDRTRVVVQWSDDGRATWHAASPQASTIGGDIADATSNLVTVASHDAGLTIDPASNAFDHKYIWAMSRDIERPIKAGDPLPGGGISDGTKSPFNLRVIPFGAVQGNLGVSKPVTVLFNTKVVSTILPLVDADGTVNPYQGGDIELVIHLRDVDGAGPGSPGDPADVLVEFARDLNGDGQITVDANEFFNRATPAGEPVGAALYNNPLLGQATYFDAPEDSDPVTRDPAQGWASFEWDALYDLGAPLTQFNDVWVRVISSDGDEGFPVLLRNTPETPQAIFVIKDPEALYVKGFDHTGNPDTAFEPAGGDEGNVQLNEPLRVFFNGLIDPGSVNTNTLRVFRNSSRVLGATTVSHDVAANESTVTFFPLAQSTDSSGVPVYGANDATTVLYQDQEYRIEVPGYTAGNDPRNGDFLRLDNGGFGNGVVRSYLLVQNLPISGDQSTHLRFTARSGYFDDGFNPALDVTVPRNPVDGSTLNAYQGFTFNVNKAVDYRTVNNASITVRSPGPDTTAVVPGTWRVTNTIDPNTGATSSSLTFIPFIQGPSAGSYVIQSLNGLLADNGRSIAQFTGNYTVSNYGRTNTSFTETYSNRDNEDTTFTTAGWGNDPCAPGALTGLQGGANSPTGADGPLTVSAGDVVELNNSLYDFTSITVEKGGRLLLRSTSGPMTIRVTEDVTIRGTVDYHGENGFSGVHGNNQTTMYPYYYYGTTSPGTRTGGRGYNGGGSGADSVSTSNNNGTSAGSDGSGSGAGKAGTISTLSSSYYSYGAGGGSGAGHGAPGKNGGRATSYRYTSAYGPQSIGGSPYGDENMTNGVTPGSGGGSGGSRRYSSTWFHNGGAAGAGAGAIDFIIDGTLNLAPSGLIDGRGGDGGASHFYGGSGGAGSGGGFRAKVGAMAILDGIIDLRGGIGGAKGWGYYSDTYSYYYAFSYGTTRFGGDAGGGRGRIEAGNFGNTDDVRVFGQLMTRQISQVPTTTAATEAPHSAWLNGGTVPFGTSTVKHYNSNLTVNAGRVVTLTGTKPVAVYVDGDITINGTVQANGGEAPSGSTTYYNLGFEYNYGSLATAAAKGYDGVLGGGNGGASQGASGMYTREGYDGTGPSPGMHHISSNPGYLYSNYHLYFGQAGGGGGGNATAGEQGWVPYALSCRYQYTGVADDTNGTGVLEKNGGQGGAALDPANMDINNFANFAGSGGGAGNDGGYGYTTTEYYFGLSGKGAGAPGALTFVASGTVTVNGTISMQGGEGNAPGVAYYVYSTAGGGGASGGTCYLIGDMVNIAPVTVPFGSTANGARFDLTGGPGGGWRMPRTGIANEYPTYNSAGMFGGDGGFGRLVIDYVTSLNNGRTLFNRYGHQSMNGSTLVWKDAQMKHHTLGGTMTRICYGTPRGGEFRSKWFDLGSLRPVVNSLSMSTTGMILTLKGEGAQSHPHNPGPNGVGEPDASNKSGLRSAGAGFLNGWRWFRFDGVFSRQSTTGPAPTGDNTTFGYETDVPQVP